MREVAMAGGDPMQVDEYGDDDDVYTWKDPVDEAYN